MKKKPLVNIQQIFCSQKYTNQNMLRTSTTNSRLLQSGLIGGLYTSSRCVHWFHSYKQAGNPRDRYELDRRGPEFGQDEITDKDRNPHLYWGIWQGRTMIQRVVNQFGYSKDLKPDKVKRDFEKFTYFAKLDALHFLQEDRSNYPWMDDDADGAIGYNTDEGDTDSRFEHSDYGKYYKDASAAYSEMILKDQNLGRPVYEWQVPYGLDEAYGYNEGLFAFILVFIFCFIFECIWLFCFGLAKYWRNFANKKK